MLFMGICLITDDVPALTQFYEKVLQTSADGNDVHAEIKTEGAALAIYSKSSAEKDMPFHFKDHSGTRKFTMGFSVDDVDAEYERLRALGVEFVTLPTTYGWGNKAMHFKDSDGNIVGFSCRCN